VDADTLVHEPLGHDARRPGATAIPRLSRWTGCTAGDLVDHVSWGPGTVFDQRRITVLFEVLFDKAGYRHLDAGLVDEGNLLAHC
jgi:hypothetical protein